MTTQQVDTRCEMVEQVQVESTEFTPLGSWNTHEETTQEERTLCRHMEQGEGEGGAN